MSTQNAVLFNGAAALIAQEVGLVDLLREFEGLEFEQNNTFVAGLSSGALVTFAVNAAFSDNPVLPWQTFKDDILFPITTSDIFTGSLLKPPVDTSPLRSLLSSVVNDKCGFKTYSDLPFQNALLTASYMTFQTYWINNVTGEIPIGNNAINRQLREQTNELDLVDLLMCSTAIPLVFPSQNMRFHECDQEQYIRTFLEQKAKFVDGGTFGTFSGLEAFFNTTGQKFDKLYFVTPNFGKNEQLASEMLGSELSQQNEALVHYMSAEPGNTFAQNLKAYNDTHHLANEIYVCMPDIRYFNPLNFDTQVEQYQLTMQWGKSNPDDIAINLNDWVG